jgi:hypothetical protein
VKFLHKVFNYLIGAGLVGYGIFFYFHGRSLLRPDPGPVQVTNSSSIDPDKMVNKILQETTAKMKRDQYLSNRVVEEALKKPLKLPNQKEMTGTEVPREAQIHKANEIDVSSAPVKPQEQQGLSKEEYARQYIENARRGGYDIELNDQMEVIKSTPIRKPSQDSVDAVEILPSN